MQISDVKMRGLFGAEKWGQFGRNIQNSVELKLLEFGRDSLTVNEIEQIDQLANSCPAVEGLGVYKAQFLNAFFKPLAHYDDYAVCAPANKGGDGTYDDLLGFLNNPSERVNQNENFNSVLSPDQVELYPIPAQNSIYVKCGFDEDNTTSSIHIYDLFGRMLIKQRILTNNKMNTIDISMLSNGMYTYRIESFRQSFLGKFNIIK